MTDEVSSRERLLTAIGHKEADHVPLYYKWWGRPFLRSPSEPFRNQFHRVDESLKMGLDDTVTFEVSTLTPQTAISSEYPGHLTGRFSFEAFSLTYSTIGGLISKPWTT